MNSVILKFIIGCVIFVTAIIVAIVEHHPDNKKEKILFVGAIIVAITTFVLLFFDNDVPAPYIDREADYSAIILSTDEPMDIEYRISTNGEFSDEWIKYEKPFKLERNAIIYARASTLWFTSEQVFRDVYVAQNDLVYFSSVEEPGDTIVSINADYNYRDTADGETGNHYIGYEIKKSDLKVVGVDLNGNEKEITDFAYSPKVLKSGKNDIEVKYSIASDVSVDTHLYINGDIPAMVKLNVNYIGGNLYLDDALDSTNFSVKGTYEDGTVKEITGYSISPTKVTEGKNKITITKDGLSDVIEITAIDRETITENESEPNDEIRNANDIEVNVKYSGILKDSDDADYYKLRLDKKGKIIIKLTHPKLDEDGVFWVVSLLSQEEDTRVELSSSGRNVETTSSPVRLSPGIYYVKVSNYNHSIEKYTMTMLFDEEDESYENEPNDDLNSQAMVISSDKKYTGNLTNEDDVDYYKFSLNEKRKVWIDFSHEKTNEDHTLWNISLFGDSDGSLLNVDSTGDNAKIISDSIRLPAGNYYIRISDYYWSDLDYTFCICSQQEGEGTEDEDNGDYGLATLIALNSSIVGNIQSEDDVDFYRFDLQSDTSVKVTFSHNLIDNGNTFWRFELYSMDSGDAIANNENYTTIDISGDSAESISSKWKSLQAGTYYLKVYGYYYNNDDYKITLSN